MIALAPRTTALVLVDLQNGVLSRKLEPLSADELLERGKALAGRFRAAGAPGRPGQRGACDQRHARRRSAFRAAQDLAGRLRRSCRRPRRAQRSHDHQDDLGRVLPHRPRFRAQAPWDTHHRPGGVATQFGVESTARQAWELGYELVIVRDATTSIAIEGHNSTMRGVFPRIARVTDSDALAFATA